MQERFRVCSWILWKVCAAQACWRRSMAGKLQHCSGSTEDGGGHLWEVVNSVWNSHHAVLEAVCASSVERGKVRSRLTEETFWETWGGSLLLYYFCLVFFCFPWCVSCEFKHWSLLTLLLFLIICYFCVWLCLGTFVCVRVHLIIYVCMCVHLMLPVFLQSKCRMFYHTLQLY